MTGLLQRLAARATGSAWALRSDARLPFAAMPGLAEAPGAETLAPPAPQDPVQTGKAARAMPQPVVPTTATVMPSPPPLPARAWPMAVETPSPAVSQDRPGPAAAPTRNPFPEMPPLRDRAPPDRSTAAAVVHSQTAQAPMAQGVVLRDGPAPLLPANPVRRTGAARPSQGPAPLAGTPPRAPHAFAPLRQSALAQSGPAQSGPAEVHVHIGRVEVMAITQPPPARRAAREAAQPLSLNAYLARRKEPS